MSRPRIIHLLYSGEPCTVAEATELHHRFGDLLGVRTCYWTGADRWAQGAARANDPRGGSIVCGTWKWKDHPMNPKNGCQAPGCKRWGDYLCDEPVGKGKTCDLALCYEHAHLIAEDTHLCPIHRARNPDPLPERPTLFAGLRLVEAP